MDDCKEGEDFRRLDLEKIVNAYLDTIPEGADLKESRATTDILYGNEYHVQIQDATTQEARDVSIRPDLHGCVVTVADRDIILDLSDGKLRVFVAEKDTGDVVDEPAAVVEL